MKKDIVWDEVLNEYQASGLQQKEFCLIHDLPLGKFQYHLYRNKPSLRTRGPLEQVSSEPITFEPVILKPLHTAHPQCRAVKLSIRLPNTIACEIKLPSYELSEFLRQLGGLL